MNIQTVGLLIGALCSVACVPAPETRTATPALAPPLSAALPRKETSDEQARHDASVAAPQLRLALPPPPHLRVANTCCGLSNAQIEDAIFSRPLPFLNCYAEHGGSKSGKLVLSFKISTDGRVKAVRVVEDEMMRPKLTSCVLSAARSVTFPRAPLPTVATCPLRFKATAV